MTYGDDNVIKQLLLTLASSQIREANSKFVVGFVAVDVSYDMIEIDPAANVRLFGSGREIIPMHMVQDIFSYF